MVRNRPSGQKLKKCGYFALNTAFCLFLTFHVCQLLSSQSKKAQAKAYLPPEKLAWENSRH